MSLGSLFYYFTFFFFFFALVKPCIVAEHYGVAEIERISIYGIARLKSVTFRPKTSAALNLPSACGARVDGP